VYYINIFVVKGTFSLEYSISLGISIKGKGHPITDHPGPRGGVEV
jgi:hypothetical protein